MFKRIDSAAAAAASLPRRIRAAMFGSAVVAALALGTSPTQAVETIAVEVTAPPPDLGIDTPTLRSTAEGEIRRLDVPSRRRVVVSLALARVTNSPVGCTVSAILRDARTGAMIAIIEAGAQAEGEVSGTLRTEVASAAIRRAVRNIPKALAKR